MRPDNNVPPCFLPDSCDASDRAEGRDPLARASTVPRTLSLYAHVTDASQEALVDAIDARYGPRLRVVAGSELDAE